MAVTALLNWWAVARSDVMIERITKPTFMVLLMGLAWALHGEGRPEGAPPLVPVLVALGLSLVGDVALLNSTKVRFLIGLGAFLLAHIAWIWAVLSMARVGGVPWLVIPTAPVLLFMVTRFGRDIVRSSGPDRGPVFVYLLTLVVLALVAAWQGDPVVLIGALVFMVSDTILGHDRFVLERKLAPLQVMVTYHLAQTLIVVGLLR